MIVGITGTICSGKRELAGVLEKEGFEYKSLNDYLPENSRVVSDKYLPEDIFHLRESNHLNLVGKFKEDIGEGNYVINNIESLAEIEDLREMEDFHLFFIGGDVRRRYHKWAMKMKDEFRTREELKRFNRGSWMDYWTFYKNNFDTKIRGLKSEADFSFKSFVGESSLEKQFQEVYKKIQ